jgi:dihydroorotate dehydrogenase electron transfer subunit
MFNVHGEGTRYLSEKKEGDILDILAPLGNGFNIEGDYKTAVIVAGGIGAAPFPLLTRYLISSDKKIVTLMGGRNKNDLTNYGLVNLDYSTDDGSKGFHGNVVQLFKSKIENYSLDEIKVFACGPTPMLKALKEFCDKNNIQCEISTECAMACGFGICQGCPIESTFNGEKYLLVCKDGPVFNSKDVIL